MASAVFLTLAFVIFQVNSQILGTIQRGYETNTPCFKEVCRQSVPVGVKSCSTKQSAPNLISVSQPISNTMPMNQPCSNAPTRIVNIPAPSCVQNQVPFNEQVINIPTQQFVNNVVQKCPNAQTIPTCTNAYSHPACTNTVQVTPPVIRNTESPVLTVVDSTLANSLANALQLLILSNILDNPGTCNSQNLPCINNYEIVTPDLTDITNAICSESIFIPGPVCNSPEPVYSYQEHVVCSPEPSVYQAYPTNFGYPVVDNAGFQCGQNQILFESANQYQVVPTPCESKASFPAVTTPPIGLEVPFPASIPAQLTCNFGILPTNQPCVTFNVEPMPLGSFGNLV